MLVISANRGQEMLTERLKAVAELHEAGIFAETISKNNAKFVSQIQVGSLCFDIFYLI